MNRLFTKFIFTMVVGFLTVSASAQVDPNPINDMSPVPANFVVNAPASISGIYDFGNQVSGEGEWGTRLVEDLSAEIVWAYDSDADSLLCNPADNSINDVTGKFALIRRGACGFSLKTYNAQVAGAVGAIICNHFDNADDGPETLVGMLGGDSIDVTVIPAIFVSRQTCEALSGAIDGGETVSATFDVQFFSNPIAQYAYATPITQITPLDAISVDIANVDSVSTVSASATVVITEPNGNQITLDAMGDIEPESTGTLTFPEYTPPAELGTYTLEFSNSINSEVLTSEFVITEYTFATDNYEFAGGIGRSDEDFANEDALIAETGSTYFIGDEPAMAQAVSFGVTNAADLVTDADEVTFIIGLYNGDVDGDDVFDLENTFDDLTPGLVGFASYTLTGNEGPEELITVPLESVEGDPLVELMANGVYVVTVEYDGSIAGNGVSPQFLSTAKENSAFNFATPLFLDQLYTGWNTRTIVTRLHLDGFLTNVRTPEFASNVLAISPNPATDVLQLMLDFPEANEQVAVGITDMQGRTVRVEEYGTLTSGTFNLDVSDLANGIYNIAVRSTTGWQVKRFVKVN